MNDELELTFLTAMYEDDPIVMAILDHLQEVRETNVEWSKAYATIEVERNSLRWEVNNLTARARQLSEDNATLQERARNRPGKDTIDLKLESDGITYRQQMAAYERSLEILKRKVDDNTLKIIKGGKP